MVNKRNKNRNKPQRAAPLTSSGPNNLLEKANTDLKEAKFRDAIDAYKALAKTDSSRELWEPGLLEAYRGRALELEAKGMEREALMIWENRVQVCPQRVPDPRHLALMLRLGRVGPLMEGYQRLLRDGAADAIHDLRTRIAALVLAGQVDPGVLADDDPVRKDGSVALLALSAYCRGEDAAVNEALRAIPFRSPFRDLVMVLRALLAWPGDHATVKSLLARVPASSPFAPLVDAVQLVLHPESKISSVLEQAKPRGQTFAQALLGWSQDRINLWRELVLVNSKHNAVAMISMLRRKQACLGDSWVRRKIRNMMLTFPKANYTKPMWSDFSGLESSITLALHADSSDYASETIISWLKVIEVLKTGGAHGLVKVGSDDALKIAIIQRHLALDLQYISYQPTRKDALDALEESIVWDPDYQPGYLFLINFYRDNERIKDARRVSDRAEKRWRDDVVVLKEVMEVAIAGGAIKKAATLAERILRHDPINRQVRDRIFDAFLKNMRKRWRNKRADLALNELESALAWASRVDQRSYVDLLASLIRFHEGAADASTLKDTAERIAPGFLGSFMVALEANLLGLSVAAVLKQAKLVPVPGPDADGLKMFAKVLRERFDQHSVTLDRVLEPFSSVLKSAAKLPLERDDYEVLCETFWLVSALQLCSTYARAALKRWPDDPLFALHFFQSKSKNPWAPALTDSDYQLIYDALDTAIDQNNTALVVRIQKVLNIRENMAEGDSYPETDDSFDELLDLPPGAPSIEDLKAFIRRHGKGQYDDVLDVLEGKANYLELFRIISSLDFDWDLDPTPRSKPTKKGKKANRRRT